MSTASIVTAAIADIRTKFIEAAEDIKTAADVKGYSTHVQPGLPYWTLRMLSVTSEEMGNNLVRYDITAEAIYHGWAITEGQAGEAEQAAQLNLVLLPAELRARPRFQSVAYPAGTGYLASLGAQVTGARIAQTENGAAALLAVVVDITIPLELQLEEGF